MASFAFILVFPAPSLGSRSYTKAKITSRNFNESKPISLFISDAGKAEF
jgi:hypothetical protein